MILKVVDALKSLRRTYPDNEVRRDQNKRNLPYPDNKVRRDQNKRNLPYPDNEVRRDLRKLNVLDFKSFKRIKNVQEWPIF